MIPLALAHPASTRLGLALVGVILFGAISSAGVPGRVRLAPVAVLTALVVIWMFGATLIWGTGYQTKFRFAAAWQSQASAWQPAALLAVAFAGVIALAVSVRASATQDRQRARTFEVLAAICFVGWSAVVNYPVTVAVVMGIIGLVALENAAEADIAEIAGTETRSTREARRRWRIPLVTTTMTVALTWLALALLWGIAAGVREEPPNCGCWADNSNAWQFGIQLLVAIFGSTALITTVILFLRARGPLWIAASLGIAAIASWVAFVVTGT